MMETRKVAPTARAEGLVVTELTDETLVYDLTTNKAHCLNRTAALVWRHCDGARTVSDIADLLTIELGAPVGDELVWLALDQLSKDRLLHKNFKMPVATTDFSRRRMMKRMGVAVAVAVPLVTSLIVPKAAQAGSGCGSSSCDAQGVGCPANCTCPNGGGTCF